MNPQELEILVKDIVVKAYELANKFTDEHNLLVNYACVFSHTQKEYKNLIEVSAELGRLVKEYPNGLLFELDGIITIAGTLKLLKIRQPDITRPEMGDADFTLKDYFQFRSAHLGSPGFKLIERPEMKMEMIEYMQSGAKVRVYFSNPPLIKVLGIE